LRERERERGGGGEREEKGGGGKGEGRKGREGKGKSRGKECCVSPTVGDPTCNKNNNTDTGSPDLLSPSCPSPFWHPLPSGLTIPFLMPNRWRFSWIHRVAQKEWQDNAACAHDEARVFIRTITG